MAATRKANIKMRVLHRYLGFFLSGIMAVYAVSGIVLIFRDSDTFKKEIAVEKQLDAQLTKEALPQAINIRRLKVTKEEGALYYFENGTYNTETGLAKYTKKELPYILDKLTHFHKAKSGEPLFFFNIFFGLGLLFFVLSAFWMFMPGTSIFRKGLIYALAGIALALILLFV